MTQDSQIKMDSATIERLLTVTSDSSQRPRPPIHQWHPPFTGDIDIQIKKNGEWFYQGSVFTRLALVKMFSSILRREADGDYYLVTPVEKYRINVEDAPFVATQVERLYEAGVAYLCFTTQTEERVIVDANHPLWVNYDATGEPRPYLRVRDNLDALIARNVFYQLVDWATIEEVDGQPCYAVSSAGQYFSIASE
ncbi:DUF1285 domain-containing protein [Agitococcus lubricus]|uniref:DUF1285 domain-containing protein n=1 Tax=Agitococcus lubricus TaxID=1077255 RepID=A0A2T5IX80_9GAMM|nr:DUF1285 domain-containing protein [Agitococcus lubricus]PTQ88519.1 hypothetical protein C8N29_11140 [Agitococcus lubricus]